jgi:hypothetical protein
MRLLSCHKLLFIVDARSSSTAIMFVAKRLMHKAMTVSSRRQVIEYICDVQSFRDYKMTLM